MISYGMVDSKIKKPVCFFRQAFFMKQIYFDGSLKMNRLNVQTHVLRIIV